MTGKLLPPEWLATLPGTRQGTKDTGTDVATFRCVVGSYNRNNAPLSMDQFLGLRGFVTGKAYPRKAYAKSLLSRMVRGTAVRYSAKKTNGNRRCPPSQTGFVILRQFIAKPPHSCQSKG